MLWCRWCTFFVAQASPGGRWDSVFCVFQIFQVGDIQPTWSKNPLMIQYESHIIYISIYIYIHIYIIYIYPIYIYTYVNIYIPIYIYIYSFVAMDFSNQDLARHRKSRSNRSRRSWIIPLWGKVSKVSIPLILLLTHLSHTNQVR